MNKISQEGVVDMPAGSETKMTDKTEREAFEKVCSAPFFLTYNTERNDFRLNLIVQDGNEKAEIYNAKWQGFQLGRAQDADRKDAERLTLLRESYTAQWECLTQGKPLFQSQKRGKNTTKP